MANRIHQARKVDNAEMTAMRVAHRAQFLRIEGGPCDYECREVIDRDGVKWIVGEVFQYTEANIICVYWSRA